MGRFLTTGCCFPYCFLEILLEVDKAVIEGDKVVILPTSKNSGLCFLANLENFESS